MPKKRNINYSKRATQYARDVVAGKVPNGELAIMACKRHLDDLDRSRTKAFPYRFDHKKGDYFCAYAERQVHVKGDWAKYQPEDPESVFIRLENWQCFLFASLFGWVDKKTGLRRFDEAYWEIPRKNAKSTMGAIVVDFMAVADGEHGAECFCGATTEKQAMKVFEPAWLMVANNPELQEHFGISLGGTPENPGVIYKLKDNSRLSVLIGNPGDGDNVHCAVIDEYHEHASSHQRDAMQTGMGSRRQPLLLETTTAGVDTSSPCFLKHQEAEKVLKGTIDNPKLFAMIFGMNAGDDWKNFDNWIKANPNYGVSVYEHYLRGQLRRALQSPDQQNAIRTKHLNEWLNAGVSWMNMALWDRQKDAKLRIEDFKGQPCWLALDLANKIDICSLAMIFELIDRPGYALFARHYLCEETIKLSHNDHYRKWVEMGAIQKTLGARTDFRQIESDVKNDLAANYVIQSLAFDPKEATYLISNIQEWASFDCIEINQGPALMSEPMKELEAMVQGGDIWHDGDPVLTWMMGNVVKKEGRGGGVVKYYYPTKQNNKDKIDGAVAAIMAISRAKLADPVEYLLPVVYSV